MDREEFIERQVAFQFGTCHASGPMEKLKYKFNPETDPDPNLNERCDALVKELRDLGLKWPVIAQMRDAIRNSNTFPVFQYNRLQGAKNSILWPLTKFHDLGKKNFCSLPDPSEPRLQDKKPIVFWRGAVRGFSALEGKYTSVPELFEQYDKNLIDKHTLMAHLKTVPRYAFVSRYFDTEGFDIGFRQAYRGGGRLERCNEFRKVARFNVDAVKPAEQLQYKYLISIQGKDVGSSFGWHVGTNSVVMKESYSWEVFFDCHFRPWEHYVPIAPDFSDIPEKMAWCESNPDACQAMVDKRHEVVRLLIDPDIRREALTRVVARYNDFYERRREQREQSGSGAVIGDCAAV